MEPLNVCDQFIDHGFIYIPIATGILPAIACLHHLFCTFNDVLAFNDISPYIHRLQPLSIVP